MMLHKTETIEVKRTGGGLRMEKYIVTRWSLFGLIPLLTQRQVIAYKV